MKDKTTALILSVLLGGLGVDRFYLGYMGMGVLKLLTGGCFGILWIIDIINIATGKLQPVDGSYEDNTPRQQKTSLDLYSELEKLALLHKQGILSDEEYKEMKNCILNNR